MCANAAESSFLKPFHNAGQQLLTTAGQVVLSARALTHATHVQSGILNCDCQRFSGPTGYLRSHLS